MAEDIFHLGIKALIVNAEGKLLLLRVDPKKLIGDGIPAYWDIPGGRIQKDASPEDTLRREVEEETGITDLQSIQPFSMVLSNIRIPAGPSDFGLVLASYVCRVNEPADVRLSEEHTEYGWYTMEEAAELLSYKYPKVFTDQLLSEQDKIKPKAL